MKIFISQASGRSCTFAKEVYTWLESAPLGLTPWAAFNKNDLPVGADDYGRILEAAHSADFCLSIIADESDLSSPWINFESGLFYLKKDNKASVINLIILTERAPASLVEFYF